MKAYFEYISENQNSFRRFKFQWILVILVLCFFLGTYFFITKKEIRQYSHQSGVVDVIRPSKVRVKPGGTYDLRKFVEKEVIEININGTSYFVRYQLEKHRTNVFQKIHIGDTVELYFDKIENHLELYEIEKNGESILDYSGRNKEGRAFAGILLFLLIISMFILIFTMRLRKMYLNKKGNIF